jgi:glycerol-3-phosphate dehydrogenase
MQTVPEQTDRIFDIAVIGGGINGCGIARDAAGRGLSVYLCEQDDLASGTSSRATKLIHGGLRYLEHYEFRLVHEALAEREVLWGIAPHIIWPLRFVLPHHAGLRPAWLLRLGLFLYDHLGGRKVLPPTRTLDLRSDIAGASLKMPAEKAFEYSDCWVEDSRLVVLNAMDARAHDAVVETRHRLTAARRENDLWHLTIEDVIHGTTSERCARILVNAAGPWVGEVLGCVHAQSPARVRLVKGSHIVVKKLFDHDRCYIFQNADGRIVFAIPYEHDFTLIGTTDLDYDGDPADVAASALEIDYLCAVSNEYFTRTIGASDVVWSYSGVRPLYDDGVSKAQDATRDYVLELDTTGAPLLSVFGGKITTYRCLAESALDRLAPHLAGDIGARKWTRNAPLPGGAFPMQGFAALVTQFEARWPVLPATLLTRLARAYGTRVTDVLGDAKDLDDLGLHFGADLYEREVAYLIREEWARNAQDILWRRSKLGLRITEAEAAALDTYLRAAAKAEASA